MLSSPTGLAPESLRHSDWGQVQLPGLSCLSFVGVEGVLQPGMSLGCLHALGGRQDLTFTESLRSARHYIVSASRVMVYPVLLRALRRRCCFEYLYLTNEETEAWVFPLPLRHLPQSLQGCCRD